LSIIKSGRKSPKAFEGRVRDSRPSDYERVTLTSGCKWDLGIVRYEEIRDSGKNFYVEWLPQFFSMNPAIISSCE
jgi:hypothetical protein